MPPFEVKTREKSPIRFHASGKRVSGTIPATLPSHPAVRAKSVPEPKKAPTYWFRFFFRHIVGTSAPLLGQIQEPHCRFREVPLHRPPPRNSRYPKWFARLAIGQRRSIMPETVVNRWRDFPTGRHQFFFLARSVPQTTAPCPTSVFTPGRYWPITHASSRRAENVPESVWARA